MWRKGLGPYKRLVDALQAAVGRDYNWVRDVTISNSTWGNRLLKMFSPRAGVHALGGGIGQGMQMAIGAALAGQAAKTVCLVGDGGLMVNVGELVDGRAGKRQRDDRADERPVLRRDPQHPGRAIRRPPHATSICTSRTSRSSAQSLALTHHRIKSLDHADDDHPRRAREDGPVLVEVDMLSVGSFATAFAGPPVKKEDRRSRNMRDAGYAGITRPSTSR